MFKNIIRKQRTVIRKKDTRAAKEADALRYRDRTIEYKRADRTVYRSKREIMR